MNRRKLTKLKRNSPVMISSTSDAASSKKGSKQLLTTSCETPANLVGQATKPRHGQGMTPPVMNGQF